VQATLAFPRGQVLALAQNALYRSDDRGGTWRKVLSDSFDFYFKFGVNKMDRSPDFPWVFILREYHWDSTNPANQFGTLWFYELDTDRRTVLTTPQGNSRGPFVRVTRERGPEIGPWPITIWLGHGWDGFKVTRTTVDELRALTKGDWTRYIGTAGIHADMSDMGVDTAFHPVFLGSDGGIFKPRPPSSTATGDWVSAAVPGSGMNSLQITDLAGTNMRRSDGALLSTSLYFGTQDNNLWASPDGGKTWPGTDGAEGYDLEVRQDARPGEPITVGYVEIGGNWTEQFADANLVNQRVVPDVDQNGQPLDTSQMKQAFYLEPSAGGTSASWLRLRIGGPSNGVYVSRDGGNTWRRRFDLNFGWAGAVERTNIGGGPVVEGAAARVAPDVVSDGIFQNGVMAWVSVYLGGGGIGLVPLSNIYADRVDTIDDSDAVRLPGGGSLGLRSAQWDTHAVFGADPNDWRFLIAPDKVSGDVKVSRDGGHTWATDQKLTAQVLKGGQLKDVRPGQLPYAGHQDRVRSLPARAHPRRHPRRRRDLHGRRRQDLAHDQELGADQLRDRLSFLSKWRCAHRELGPWALVSPEDYGLFQDRSSPLDESVRAGCGDGDERRRSWPKTGRTSRSTRPRRSGRRQTVRDDPLAGERGRWHRAGPCARDLGTQLSCWPGGDAAHPHGRAVQAEPAQTKRTGREGRDVREQAAIAAGPASRDAHDRGGRRSRGKDPRGRRVLQVLCCRRVSWTRCPALAASPPMTAVGDSR
jgi:hypothetical protein